MKAVRFGPHALEKFEDLRRYNVHVAREQVEAVVLRPDHVEISAKGRKVATGAFTQHLVLRVVYRETPEAFEVVTFYPGRRSRYETPLR
jgi:hypothetical protein